MSRKKQKESKKILSSLGISATWKKVKRDWKDYGVWSRTGKNFN